MPEMQQVTMVKY